MPRPRYTIIYAKYVGKHVAITNIIFLHSHSELKPTGDWTYFDKNNATHMRGLNALLTIGHLRGTECCLHINGTLWDDSSAPDTFVTGACDDKP